ncbi:hypothetical protein FRC07_001087 [Ceratobasidium sp. 392]|nr:hypothetical protein FRC07_001087 [Ceratobasidium sp. 392]
MAGISSSNPHLLVNQTYIPTPIEWQYVNNPGIMLGPWMLGALLDFMFAGILLQKFYFYRQIFKNDALYIRIIVWTTMLLATIKTAHAFLVVWFKLVVAYGDWREAASWPWQDWTEPILSASLGAVAQIYFSVRIGVAIQIGLKDPYLDGNVPYAVVPMLVSTVRDHPTTFELVAVVDSVITLVTLFYLLRSKKGFNPHTDTIIKRLILVTFEAALPPALSAICDMITSVVLTAGNIHVAFNMLTPRLYAYSLLFTLNARAATRELALGGSDHVSIQVSGPSSAENRHVDDSFGGRSAKSQIAHSKLRVETETITIYHCERDTSNTPANIVDLSLHAENNRKTTKAKEDEVASVSSTWVPLDTKAYELRNLGDRSSTSKDGLSRDGSHDSLRAE